MKKHIQVDLEPRLQLFRTSNHNLWPVPRNRQKKRSLQCAVKSCRAAGGKWQVASGNWQVANGKRQPAVRSRPHNYRFDLWQHFCSQLLRTRQAQKKKKKKKPETEITWNVPLSLPLPLLQTSCRFHAQPGLACQRNYLHHRQRWPQLQLLSPCQGEAPSTVDPMQPSALFTNLSKHISISFKWNLFRNL